MDGHELKATAAKSVTWDQAALQKIGNDMRERGFDPSEYIDVKFSVREGKFQNMNKAEQAMFLPARTVKLGAEKIEFVEPKPETENVN